MAPDPLAPYVEAWRERFRERPARLRRRYDEARAAADRAAVVLLRDFGATRVWLVGSLTCPSAVHERSDVDLVVAGVAGARILDAEIAAEEAAEPFEVDIVRLEAAPESLRRRTHAEGLEIAHA